MKQVTVDELHPGDRVWVEWWERRDDPRTYFNVRGPVHREGESLMLTGPDGSTYNLTRRSWLHEMTVLWLLDEPEAPTTDDGTTYVTSESGGTKGSKDAAFALIPSDALWELAEHYGKGSRKYGLEVGEQDNWRKGYHWSLSYSAAFRHLTLAMGGEDVDPETGSKHVIAVAWHMLALAHWLNDEDMHKYDDRQDVMEKGDS